MDEVTRALADLPLHEGVALCAELGWRALSDLLVSETASSIASRAYFAGYDTLGQVGRLSPTDPDSRPLPDVGVQSAGR